MNGPRIATALVGSLISAVGCGAPIDFGFDPSQLVPEHCVPTVPGPEEPNGDLPPPEVPLEEPPGVLVDFTNPDDRATMTEDGLEYVVRKGSFAVYRVTSETPKIHIPGTIDGRPRTMHHTALCIGQAYFSNEASDGYYSVQIRGKVDGLDKVLEDRGISQADFGTCGGPIDVRGGTDGDDWIEDIYLTIDPAPPVGSLMPLMMMGIGFEEDPPHMNDNIRISCNELGACTWEHNLLVSTCPEPPGPSDPPTGDEPPGGGNPPPVEPPGGGDPPAEEPPGASDPPECPPGYEERPPQEPIVG